LLGGFVDWPGARTPAAGSPGLAAARTGDWPGAIVVRAGSAARATAAGLGSAARAIAAAGAGCGCRWDRSLAGGGSG